MTDKQTKKAAPDARPAYEPPRVLRLGGTNTGTGGVDCVAPGTGASANCTNGGVAVDTCSPTGGTADFSCTTGGIVD